MDLVSKVSEHPPLDVIAEYDEPDGLKLRVSALAEQKVAVNLNIGKHDIGFQAGNTKKLEVGLSVVKIVPEKEETKL